MKTRCTDRVVWAEFKFKTEFLVSVEGVVGDYAEVEEPFFKVVGLVEGDSLRQSFFVYL